MKIKKVRWVRGEVDRGKEHIQLFYGKTPEQSWDEFKPVALLSRPVRNICKVQFVLEKEGEESEAMITAVINELNFYLIDKLEPNPWAYAIYHCSTGANMYSKVHWAYFPDGDPGKSMKSKMIREGKNIYIFKPNPWPKARSRRK
ncbi:MAG: hypothetical protein OEW05_08700 [Candidatus Aminicenantes bacterium]|nr:hypothetical protein [Candidatus Aminicenantes bacterium]